MANFQIFSFIALLLCLETQISISQNSIDIALKDHITPASDGASKVLNDYTIFSFDPKAFLGSNKRSNPTFVIQMKDGSNLEFILEPTHILPEDVKIKALTPSGAMAYTMRNIPKTYKGNSTDGKAVTRISFANDFTYGFFKLEEESWYIEPLRYFDSTAKMNTSILYKADDVKAEYASYNCRHEDTDVLPMHEDPYGGNRVTGDCFKTKMAVLADYSMYIDPAHSGIENVVNHVVGVLNNVENNYELNGSTNFNDGLNFEISEMVISTCSTCDPLSSTISPNTLLNEFNAWTVSGGFEDPFNGAHFWTDRDFVGATIGLAYQSSNLYCNAKALGILEDWTNTASLMQVMVAHEIGHNLNGVHDGTSGYILSPVVSNTGIWSPTSKTTINTQITNQGNTCLEPCGPALCSRVQNASISNITNNGFSVQWDATTSDQYLVQLREKDASTFMESFTTDQNAMTLMPTGFEICKKYEILITNVCGANESATQRLIFQSPTTQGCANFSIPQPLGWSQHSVQFTNNSVNGNTYFWDFGNGQTSTLASPTATYNSVGSFDVSLTVNNVHTYTIEDAVSILPTMFPPFTVAQGGNMDSPTAYFYPSNVEGTVNLWEKGITSGSTSSPLYTQSNAWKTGLNTTLPIATTKSALYTSKFDFTQYYNYTLSFDLSIHNNYCNGPAALQLQYSLDGGATWNRLGNVPDFYNTGPGQVCQLETQVFTDRTGWTNYYATPTHYQNKSIDISSFSGYSNVIFRFVASVSAIFSAGYDIDGFLIDNFNISAQNAIVLAADETDFNAQLLENNRTLLTWQCARPQDIATFQVEKSHDGVHFETIAKIKPTENQSYTYIDEGIFSLTYYRMTAMDINGGLTVSDIKSIEPKSQTSIKVMENLIHNGNDIPIELYGDSKGIMKVALISINGIAIQEWQSNFPMRISTQALPSGTYILSTLYSNGRLQNDKVILVK